MSGWLATSQIVIIHTRQIVMDQRIGMKRLNRDGPPILGGMRAPKMLEATAITPAVVVGLLAVTTLAARVLPTSRTFEASTA